MAYREVEMWEILDVLRRVHRGETRAAIQRATGRTRKTVRRYIERARKLGWEPGGGAPDEALALEVARRLKPGGGEAAGESETRLAEHHEQIRRWLAPDDGSRGLRLTKVHELLGRLGVEVPYSSLHRFTVKHCGFHERQRI